MIQNFKKMHFLNKTDRKSESLMKITKKLSTFEN